MHQWVDIAQESLRAAELCLRSAMFRSAVSRAYYAAYSMVSDRLLRDPGLLPPDGRELWSHERTPGLFMARELMRRSFSLQTRREVARQLNSLYRMRLSADYHRTHLIDERTARRSVAQARAIADSLSRGD